MPTSKGDKSADSEGSSLAGILEALQEQNKAMQEQYKAQQKMLFEMIGQQREAHEREMKALKESKKDEVEDLAKRLPKPTLQKLTAADNVEHFWLLLKG